MRLLGLFLGLMLLAPPALQAQTPDSSAAPAALPDTSTTPGASVPRLETPPGARYRSPLLAGVLGWYAPGAGHVYAGETETGLVIVGTVAASYYVMREHGVDTQHCNFICPPNRIGVVAFLAMLGAGVYSVVDAPQAARRFNRRERPAAASRWSVAPALVGPPGAPRPGLSLHLTR